MIDYDALFKISYGLYIVTSGNKERGNGFISNTVFQVTSKPAQFAACVNKNNYTCEFIEQYGNFAVSVINKETDSNIFAHFGYMSGREFDKMEGMEVIYGESGTPIVLNEAIAYIECKVVNKYDVGSHMLFIGELLQSKTLDSQKEPITYIHYRNVLKGVAPKNAPTFVDKKSLEASRAEVQASESQAAAQTAKSQASEPQASEPQAPEPEPQASESQALEPQTSEPQNHECPICAYLYEDTKEAMPFDSLPQEWKCPVCGAGKEQFKKV